MDWLLRIEEVCRAPLSAKELRERVLAVVRERVPFDAHVFGMADPVTTVGTSPHADVPMLPWPRLPEVIRHRYQTPSRQLGALVGEPASSGLWLDLLGEIGVVDTAVVGFGDRYGAWSFLELWRTSSMFSDDELELLTRTAPAVTAGIRAVVARTFVDPADQLLPVGPAVVILGPDLQVRSQTEEAASALLQLLPPDEPMAPIPAAAYNVGAALIAQEAGVPDLEPWCRVHLGGSRWVTAKASRLGDDIAVSIEPSTPAERMDLLARSFGLSARESEVLGLLGIGLDSKEIAGQLFLSEHTVNDHVKSILAKTGARTRQQLMSRASGASR